MKSYSTLFSRIKKVFLTRLFKFFYFLHDFFLSSFLFTSLLSIDFFVSFSALPSVPFCGGWKRAWVCTDLDLGVVVDGWILVWVCRSRQPAIHHRRSPSFLYELRCRFDDVAPESHHSLIDS
jgi:hypothetical protein